MAVRKAKIPVHKWQVTYRKPKSDGEGVLIGVITNNAPNARVIAELASLLYVKAYIWKSTDGEQPVLVEGWVKGLGRANV